MKNLTMKKATMLAIKSQVRMNLTVSKVKLNTSNVSEKEDLAIMQIYKQLQALQEMMMKEKVED